MLYGRVFMKVCKLDLDIEDPKLTQIVIDGLKKIAYHSVKEMVDINENHRWSNSTTISSKNVKRIREITDVLLQITEQIEACEDGSKLIED